jgi:predicted transcriptional regulator
MDKVRVMRPQGAREVQSGHSVARELGISRNTVAKYLQTSEPVRKSEAASRLRPVTDRIAPRIDEILSEWARRVTLKQRITASRIYDLRTFTSQECISFRVDDSGPYIRLGNPK